MSSQYMSSPEYLDYLVKNCGVRGYDFDDRVEVCARPDVDIVLRYAKWLEIRPGDRVLEVGCGLGRILKELHEEYGISPSGVDSFADVIKGAEARVGDICAELRVGKAEELPFDDGAFDRIVCWGVFDLTDQTRSLAEMARVLAPGGTLLLTGKSNRFEPDDQEAFLAERGSRRKGIPNHYTDFDALLGWSATVGLELQRKRFFGRRGDLMFDRWSAERPDRFYEYALLFQRTAEAASRPVADGLVVGPDSSEGFAGWVAEHGA